MDMTEQLPAARKYQTMGDSSCENELEELMHQIDIMVNGKKVEWEKQVLALEERLEAQERELTRTRCALDQKDCEIGVLSEKLEEAEKSQRDVVQNYETQLEALKSQLFKLKKSYEKIHYYHEKNHKRDSMDHSPDHGKSQSELQWLFQKLEEHKDQAKQWETQRLLYQNNIKKLNEQRKQLLEKCHHLQAQSQRYEEQLSGRTQLQDQAITNNQSEIRRLRCQLDASQETIRSGRVIIENLKTTVKEITLSRNSLKDENQSLLQELRDCQRQCQRMESKLSEATIELQAREDLSRAAALNHRHLQEFILQNSQENKLSSQESDMFTEERTPNREKVQKRLKLSGCRGDQALKSAEEPYTFHDLTQEPEMERPLKHCSDGHKLEGLQPEMMKPVSWHREITGKPSQGKQYRLGEEDKQILKMAENDTNNNLSCYLPCDSLLVDQECLEIVFPKLRSPTQNDHEFPEMDFSDFSLLVCDPPGDSTTELGTEESFVSAAERFLQEENRRAQDFENILNSHIEELQRYSEHTVKRYTSHSHGDYHPASS